MNRSEEDAEHPNAGGDSEPTLLAWSVRRAIELLDEAIDAMGAQLIRSPAIMIDLPVELPAEKASRLVARRSSRRAAVSSRLSEFDAATGDLEEPHIS